MRRKLDAGHARHAPAAPRSKHFSRARRTAPTRAPRPRRRRIVGCAARGSGRVRRCAREPLRARLALRAVSRSASDTSVTPRRSSDATASVDGCGAASSAAPIRERRTTAAQPPSRRGDPGARHETMEDLASARQAVGARARRERPHRSRTNRTATVRTRARDTVGAALSSGSGRWRDFASRLCHTSSMDSGRVA